MTSLAAVPIGRRRQAALVVALLAVLLLVVGVLPWTAPAPAIIRALATVALLSGVFAALIAWGLARSVTVDARQRAQAEFDAAILAAHGAGCDCGHDRGAHGTLSDPPPPAAAVTCGVAADADCPHTCDTCVLAQLR